MSIKQADNDKEVRPESGPGFLKWAVALLLAMAALVGIFIAGVMYSDIAQSLSSERVYEATPEQVNPALEGKLVRMRVTGLVAEGGTLTDETFGLSKENAIALHRFYIPHSQGRINVRYHELHGIRASWIIAPQVKAGAYTLKVRDIFWDDLGLHYINPDELTLPAAWEGHVVARTQYDITLRTNDTTNLSAPEAVFKYAWIPSPWRGIRYIVGRQHGNVLDHTVEGSTLIRGEEQFQQWSRMRPALGQLLMPIWEYGFCFLGLLGGITLCLIPVVLMLQKRGWFRAGSVAALLAVLLSAMVASALLLLPYSVHNLLTWTYTVVPGLIALVFLCLTLRKRG